MLLFCKVHYRDGELVVDEAEKRHCSRSLEDELLEVFSFFEFEHTQTRMSSLFCGNQVPQKVALSLGDFFGVITISVGA